jgi:hypothetical protein
VNVYTDPSRIRLELRIPGGEVVELALFRALLSYAEGMPVIVVVGNGDNEWLLHGRETCQMIAQLDGASITGKVIRLEGDSDAIGCAVLDEACDWPEMLEAARQNFMKGSPRNESYIAWLKREIAKRGGDPQFPLDS